VTQTVVSTDNRRVSVELQCIDLVAV